MDLKRFWRHVAMTPRRARAMFPPATMEAIAAEVGLQEKRHRGEVRFVVESELTTAQLWRGLGSRDRALEVFSILQVWNTEENTGILLYVLLAERKVEIVADRGIQARVGAGDWKRLCEVMEEQFRAGRFREGAIAGIRSASDLLERHFPARESNANELPDQPVHL